MNTIRRIEKPVFKKVCVWNQSYDETEKVG